MLRNSQINAYFDRIGFKGLADEEKSFFEIKSEQTKHSLELLTKLHELHVFSIPFENLSIHLNQDIKIDIESIYKKLVVNQRGGYCYEMNGLFYAVLKKLGFDVELHLAEVSEKDSELRSRKETHLILIVHLDGKNYLTDVGFGRNGLIHPLLLETKSSIQKIYSSLFEVRYDDKNGFVYGVHFNGEFNIEYRFDLPIKRKLTLADLQEYSDDISKKSHFTKMILVSKPTKEGRTMLFNGMLKHLNGSSDSKKLTIDTYENYLSILMSEFGLRFSETLSFVNIPMLGEKMKPGDKSVSLVKSHNPIKIRASQAVFPRSNPVLMYGKGNKLTSGKVAMWSFEQSSQNESETPSLVRENCKFYR